MKALVEGGEVVEALRDRILGRVAVADVVNPETQETLYEPGTLLDETAVEEIERLGIDEVRVRTPLTCETRSPLSAKSSPPPPPPAPPATPPQPAPPLPP